jgi:hypothetical protein
MDISGLVAVTIALYCLPAMIGFVRGHHQRAAILILTLFLGWTGLGWIIALIWCATALPPASRAVAPTTRQDALTTPPAMTAFDRVRAWPTM